MNEGNAGAELVVPSDGSAENLAIVAIMLLMSDTGNVTTDDVAELRTQFVQRQG